MTLPKVELHVHLEGSIRPETVLHLAEKNRVELPYSTLEGLKEWYRFTDFPHFVQVYVAVSKCIKDPEDIEYIAKEFLVGQKEQNILHSEVTYTASTIDKYCGIPWDKQIDALERAISWGKQELGVTMGLIIDIVRGDTPERGLEVAEMAVSGMGRGVFALGLAGIEMSESAAKYSSAFDFARANGLPIIPHAGETKGPESIWDAWNAIRPKRIGHGVRCLEDLELVELLRSEGVVLEVSPTSNVCVGGVETFEDHPLPRLRDAGLRFTINSDDPPMFSTTLTDEFWKCSQTFGWDLETLQATVLTAVDSCLLPPDEREELKQKVHSGFGGHGLGAVPFDKV